MTSIYKNSIAGLVLILLIFSQAIVAQADSVQVDPEFKQELLHDLAINVEDQFHNSINEMQQYVQSSEVTEKESTKKSVHYFSIINLIVNDALSPGTRLEKLNSLN